MVLKLVILQILMRSFRISTLLPRIFTARAFWKIGAQKQFIGNIAVFTHFTIKHVYKKLNYRELPTVCFYTFL